MRGLASIDDGTQRSGLMSTGTHRPSALGLAAPQHELRAQPVSGRVRSAATRAG